MTLQEFGPVFAMLAVQMRFSDADEATIRAYYEAMRQCEVEFVKAAAGAISRRVNADGESWFPKVGEWLAAATDAEGKARDAQKAYLRRLPEPLCSGCGDTGWFIGPDNYAVRCECQKLRRLELLGRRPAPQIGPAPQGKPVPEVVQSAIRAERRPRLQGERAFSKVVES